MTVSTVAGDVQKDEGRDAPANSSGADDAGALEFARATHANLQDMVKVADAKATSLVAIQALVLAFLGPELIEALGRAWRFWAAADVPARWLKTEAFLLLAGPALIGVAALSGLCAIWTLKPRFPRHLQPPPPARGFMWMDALLPFVERPGALEKHHGPPQPPHAYVEALRAHSMHARLADFAYENLKIAWLLRRKFRWLQHAVRLLAAALLLAALTLAAWTLFIFKHPPAP